MSTSYRFFSSHNPIERYISIRDSKGKATLVTWYMSVEEFPYDGNNLIKSRKFGVFCNLDKFVNFDDEDFSDK